MKLFMLLVQNAAVRTGKPVPLFSHTAVKNIFIHTTHDPGFIAGSFLFNSTKQTASWQGSGLITYNLQPSTHHLTFPL